MNAWIDRLIELGLTADASVWSGRVGGSNPQPIGGWVSSFCGYGYGHHAGDGCGRGHGGEIGDGYLVYRERHTDYGTFEKHIDEKVYVLFGETS